MYSDFEQIKRTTEDGQEYWTSRELGNALGYSTYQKFTRILNKAIAVANNKGMKTADHFNQTVEMVKLGSGTFRKVENMHLSRMACLIIAENADGKKPQVQIAREYFKQEVTTTELAINTLSSNILLYKTKQGEARIEVVFNNETFWMSQKRMAELYDVDVRTVNYHLKEIFKSGELNESSVIRKIWITANDGKDYDTYVYNLDAIIAVGYRVNSYQATQFRIWATSVLKEMIVKGFVLDDERLKQGKHFGKDYFDDLLERIREIRASERRYYQKITDVYAECSADYDPKAETTQLFFKMVQNMMHWAVTHQTAAEIIYSRADAEMPHMGLTTWKNAPDGRVQRSDTIVAKNYLEVEEIDKLNRLVNLFLESAELRVKERKDLTLDFWRENVKGLLSFQGLDILANNGNVSNMQMEEYVRSVYAQFDAHRKSYEAQLADEADLKQMDDLGREVKERK